MSGYEHQKLAGRANSKRGVEFKGAREGSAGVAASSGAALRPRSFGGSFAGEAAVNAIEGWSSPSGTVRRMLLRCGR